MIFQTANYLLKLRVCLPFLFHLEGVSEGKWAESREEDQFSDMNYVFFFAVTPDRRAVRGTAVPSEQRSSAEQERKLQYQALLPINQDGGLSFQATTTLSQRWSVSTLTI